MLLFRPAHVESASLLERRIRITFWVLAPLFGSFQAWNSRHVMNADGISYLDLADAYLHGGWRMLVNGHWSPLYPWLLALAKILVRPSAYWEFTMVHVVNFFIYCMAAAAFELLLCELRWQAQLKSSQDASPSLPFWAIRTIAYVIFLWASLSLITLERKSPDMLMSVFAYLASAVVLGIRNGRRSYSAFACLGVILGLGYLAKAPMFPLAFLFLGVALFAVRPFQKVLPGAMLALFLFLFVSAPLIVSLSQMKSRLTFGDSGRWNYLFEVNGAGPSWYMQTVGTARGKFQHPPQKIFDFPPAYAFLGPIGGTLPVWYDPSYWIEGAQPHFDRRGQLDAIKRNARTYFDLFFLKGAGIVGTFLALWFMADSKQTFLGILRAWPMWVPAFAALSMYVLVLVRERYIAVFLVLLWLCLFSSLRFSRGEHFHKLAAASAFPLIFVLGVPLLISAAQDFKAGIHQRHLQWEIAEQLRRMGVQPGTEVGRIGGLFRAEWARLLGVRVIAEIPRPQAQEFWSSSPEVQLKVLESFRRAGATAIIAEQIPPTEVFSPSPGWKRIGDSFFYANLLGNSVGLSAQTLAGSSSISPQR